MSSRVETGELDAGSGKSKKVRVGNLLPHLDLKGLKYGLT